MSWKPVASLLVGLSGFLLSTAVSSAGTLTLYNWESYTSPELLASFEQAYDIKVRLIEYRTSEAALSEIRDGTVQADLAVVASNFLPAWREAKLLRPSGAIDLANYRYVQKAWTNPPFDPERMYSVPWAWGIVGVTVHADRYEGDINTWSVVLDPPEALKGTINIGADPNEVIYAAVRLHGGRMCDAEPALMSKVRTTLLKARPTWKAMDYGSVEMMASGHFQASIDWNGAALRQRLANPHVHFGLPREGTQVFSDSLVLLAEARNVENARLFMNFILSPRNAALNSSFHGYDTGIEGADMFLSEELRSAPELNIPKAVLDSAEYTVACPPEVQELYAKVWDELQH
ncbi:extracellular solute-binding protein [Pseudomonas benzopyrenica]|uniref:extracellular solute-binding protein n=1 Tax=Pseudomonas benzopyrenica TaxID=2993566 RepID=UPI0039C4AFB7